MAIVKSLLLLFACCVVLAAVLLLFVLQVQPSVPSAPVDLSADNVEAMRLLSAANDPRALAPGESGVLELSEKDLEIALGYLMQRLDAGHADVILGDGAALVRLSARLPLAGVARYLNVQAEVRGGKGFPGLAGLRVGRLALPDWLAQRLLARAQAVASERYPEYGRLRAAIEAVDITSGSLRVHYVWDPELLRQLSRRGGELLLPEPFLERLAQYRQELGRLTAQPDLSLRVSATTFLQPLFGHALTSGGDPVEENRALLLALSLYALDMDLVRIVAPQATTGELPRHELQLYRRSDFGQHFFSAVGLTLSADAGLADSLGLLKEIEDTRGEGSGFSFTDIGADRMGARFAEFAVSNPANARRLQQAMAVGTGESHYFPDFRELPEFLDQAQFISRYGTTTSPVFLQEIDKIDSLINGLPIFEAGP
ncbi:MAG TPA: hypothetical protein VNR18_06405 [Hyphomicrobiales bacterium]|nr:hypothetical protein [Hyphomicrobiales bacterium]